MTAAAGKSSPPVESETSARARLAGWLKERFFVRFHLSLILAFSFGVGLLTTRGALLIGMETMVWRWPLALIAAYLAFLLALRLWLSYIGLGRYLESESSIDIEIPDIEFSGSGGGSGGMGGSGGGAGLLDSVGEVLQTGGGGNFGGGGASGEFSTLVDVDLASGASSGISLPDVDLPDLDVGGDDGCLPIIILALILALLAAVLGVGVYLVWQAPVLLAEVAFEAALAAGLVRSVRKVDDPGWVGGALSASWKPFALILILTVIAAVLAESFAPEAKTLPQVVHQLMQ